ncbi:geranylgeranylglycerol-phosphate geranylgeranyltransferase [Niabella insulamsoli]|uniref:geranylgeranylglycerol-phosphate geranylgeranyltransferase n=1 Tax=Niabella insulamsoli TaxID=3144874 RepID=UPI0031FC5C4F
MALLKPFLKLIRWPNLVFIIITQLLFEYCIYRSVYAHNIPDYNHFQFVLLVVASVLIAAAGYIINDYFDINIDLVNKPDRIVLDKTLSRRWALAWHLIFSVVGVVLTAIAVGIFSRWYLIIANIVCVILLWFYSARFKKDLLIGNIIVSLLTAWTILIIFLSKYSFMDAFSQSDTGQGRFFKFAILYAGFAFIISLIREAVKDIEDMPGDEKFGCRTMPIVWGINATKVYVMVWLTVLIIMLLIIQIYVMQFRWWWAVAYCFVFIFVPLLFIFRTLIRAQSTRDYSRLSLYTKLAMFAGILSMIFFHIYL